LSNPAAVSTTRLADSPLHGRARRDHTSARVSAKRNCLSVRFRCLTEEFPEFLNDIYNDASIAELDTSSGSSASRYRLARAE
jgi:hypothetical protein